MTIQPTPIELEVLLDDDIAVELDVLGDEEVQLEVWSEVVREHADYPDYDGEYVITPSFDSQTLQTTGKIMRDDVAVEPITVSRTSNLAGGNTIYIGGVFTDGE